MGRGGALSLRAEGSPSSRKPTFLNRTFPKPVALQPRAAVSRNLHLLMETICPGQQALLLGRW